MVKGENRKEKEKKKKEEEKKDAEVGSLIVV